MKAKRKKWIILVILLSVLIVMALSPFMVNAHVMHTSEAEILKAEEAAGYEADCILVLGALVYDNGDLSDMLKDRVKVGIQLYESGAGKKTLMSGDHGTKEYDEVNAMKKYAMAAGVPEEDIFMDHAGFCTYDSIYRAKEVFDVKKVIIVTQEYHLYRALYIAESLGIEAVGVDSDLQGYLGQDKRDFREFLARNKEFVTCLVQPEPKYLGEVIPISGDGRATQD